MMLGLCLVVIAGSVAAGTPTCAQDTPAAVTDRLAEIARAGAVVDPPGVVRIEAEDESVVSRQGEWRLLNTFPRSVDAEVLATGEAEARLRFTFRGRSLALVLPGTWQNPGPSYGGLRTGGLVVRVGDRNPTIVDLATAPQNVVIASDLPAGEHEVSVGPTEPAVRDRGWIAVDGFKVGDFRFSTLAFRVDGEESASLNDVRVVVRAANGIVSSTVTRNAMTGECVVTGLRPGTYEVTVHATGWEAVRREGIVVEGPGDVVRLEPIVLRRESRAQGGFYGIIRPNRGRTVSLQPGETFDVFCRNGTGAVVRSAALKTAHLQIPLEVVDGEVDRYYYENTVRLRLPPALPRGLYDLELQVVWREGDEGYPALAPQAVQVRGELGEAFYLVGFGHTNTWGQVTAEWMGELAQIVNLIHPELVLISNEVNWAYLAGALAQLRVPYFITAGNHSYPNFEAFYGARLSVFDFGPLRGVNAGPLWTDHRPRIAAAFEQRPDARIRVINTYEPNLPVEELLDAHGIHLVHDAHGPGQRVDRWGETPTWRVGKSNADSFRLIRFRDGHVVSATYRGDAVEPMPLPRSGPLPLAVAFDDTNDGTRTEATAEIVNGYDETFEHAQVEFVMAKGQYRTSRGTIAQQFDSSDGMRTIVQVALDVQPASIERVTVRR